MNSREQLQKIYLDWFNNFLSIRVFSQYYGISEESAIKLIDVGREVHNQIAELEKYKDSVAEFNGG